MFLGPIQRPIRWVLGGFYRGLKRSVRDVEHSPPPSAEVNREWSSTSVHPTHLYDFDRDSVTFIFISTQSFVFGIIVFLYFLVSNHHGRHAKKGRTLKWMLQPSFQQRDAFFKGDVRRGSLCKWGPQKLQKSL
jgi:hypothetical protein